MASTDLKIIVEMKLSNEWKYVMYPCLIVAEVMGMDFSVEQIYAAMRPHVLIRVADGPWERLPDDFQ